MKFTIKNENNSFFYLLHEKDIFNYKLFREFIILIVESQNTIIKDLNLKQEVITKLLYLLKVFIYHFDKNDEFKIQNFNKIKDIAPKLIDIIEYCIMKLSCDGNISKEYIENIFI